MPPGTFFSQTSISLSKGCSLRGPNRGQRLVFLKSELFTNGYYFLRSFAEIGLVVLEKKSFNYFGGFYFYAQSLQTMSHGCQISEYLESQFVRKLTKCYLFLPLCPSPLFFANLNYFHQWIHSTKCC